MQTTSSSIPPSHRKLDEKFHSETTRKFLNQNEKSPESNVLFPPNFESAPYVTGYDENGNPIQIKTGSLEDLKKDENIEVLIIGGGFAGTQALLTLRRSGVNAYLLEAQNELGGRVRSVETDVNGKSVRLDTGAQYLGRAQRSLWYLCNEVYPQFKLGSKLGIQDLMGRHEETDYPAPSNVEVLNFEQYTYPDPNTPQLDMPDPDTMQPWSPHYNPEAGSAAVMPFQFDWLSDLTPIEGVITKTAFYNAIEYSPDPFFSKEKNPEKQYPNTIRKTLLELDQMSVWDWTMQQSYLSAHMRGLLRISVAAPLSLEPEEVSAFDFMSYCKSNGSIMYLINDAQDGPQQYILKSSFQSVINTMACEPEMDGRVILNAGVKNIETKAESKEGEYCEGVEVTLTDGTVLKSKQVAVMMSPFTVGKRISFGENNSSITEARNKYQSEGVAMGKTIKLFFTYKKPFWREKGEYTDPVSGEKLKRPAYEGYVGRSGNSTEYNQKYSDYRFPDPLDPSVKVGINSYDDSFNPPSVIWQMDVSNDEEGVYTLMSFVVANQVNKLMDSQTGEVNYEKCREACLNQIYSAYRRFRENPEDRDLVEGSNFIKDFGGSWDPNGFIGGGPDAMARIGAMTKWGQYLDTQEAGSSEGTVRPLFFGGAEYSLSFKGYMCGAVNSGLNTAQTIIEFLNKSPSKPGYELSKLDTLLIKEKQYYTQFEQWDDGDNPTHYPECFQTMVPSGFLSVADPPQMGAYFLLEEFEALSTQLNMLIGAAAHPMLPETNVTSFAQLIDMITGTPNPGLKPTKDSPPLIMSLTNLEKASMIMQYYKWFNLNAFFQMCNPDCVLNFVGADTSGTLQFLGEAHGYVEMLTKFVQISQQFGDVLQPWDTLTTHSNNQKVMFYGSSIIVRQGYEFDPKSKPESEWRNPKIGNWVQIDTLNYVTFDPETGYASRIDVLNDNLTLVDFLQRFDDEPKKKMPALKADKMPSNRVTLKSFLHRPKMRKFGSLFRRGAKKRQQMSQQQSRFIKNRLGVKRALESSESQGGPMKKRRLY